MVRPLVALTTTIDAKGGDHGQPRVAAYANYLLTLQQAGLTPILVTPAHDAKAISQLIDGCAGLVLSGGDDIDPSRYGRDPIPELGPVNPPRDVAECRAIDAAVGRDIPILGICRGHQMLNVYFGGSLCQDIATEFRDAVSHDHMTPWGAHHHEVTVHPDSRLARALGRNRFEINSYHHQAILDVAEGLDVTARADDGLIEAIESRHHRWIVGVQWHPERHEARGDDGDPNIRLIRAFAAEVME